MSFCDISKQLDRVEAIILAKNDASFNRISEQLTRLQALVDVQTTLVSTALTLSNHPWDCVLPSQMATKAKSLVKFAYGNPGRKEDAERAEIRSARLRKLDCNALKFCGLAFTIREMLKLSDLHFELLLQHVTEFVRNRGLVEHLYRNDICRALNSRIETPDEQRAQEFQDFLVASINAKPLMSRATCEGYQSASNSVLAKRSTTSVLEDPPNLLAHHGRPLKRQNIESDSQCRDLSLGSEVHVLTMNEVNSIIQSDQVGSDIRLMWPLYLKTPPFITIPISNSLALGYMARSPKQVS